MLSIISLKQIWSDVTNLKFTPKKFGKVHIEIRFVRAENIHSDGKRGILASARYPSSGGDIFFDDEEEIWTEEWRNTKFLPIFVRCAIHEIGHALGIRHSQKPAAVMTPRSPSLYREVEKKLDIDDIRAIQALYGAPGLPRPQIEDMEEVDIETANIM